MSRENRYGARRGTPRRYSHTTTNAPASMPLGSMNDSMTIARQRSMLPIAKHREALLYALEKHRTLIVVGETGSGKSTQLPQFLYEADWAAGGRLIVCTQPRRLACVTLASRVAEEIASSTNAGRSGSWTSAREVGRVVGYSVRFDDRSDAAETRIKFCTDGWLIRQAMRDPLLSRVSVVMVDEAHERSLPTDILLGLLKKIQRKRPDLRVVVSSATLDAERFKDFFETKRAVPATPSHPDYEHSEAKPGYAAKAPQEASELGQGSSSRTKRKRACDVAVVAVEGRTFPVDVQYAKAPVRDYVRGAVEAVLSIHRTHSGGNGASHPLDTGDVLVFLPGAEDVDNACRLTRELLGETESERGRHRSSGGESMELVALPLYAALPQAMQQRAVAPQPVQLSGRQSRQRRAIFATSIAETSLTIDGVAFVVDAGLTKLPYLNPATGLESLRTTPTSRASARQRAGRAGRTRPGQCFRLYTEAAFTASSASAAARGKGGKGKGQEVTAQPRFHLFPDADEATTAAPSPSTVVPFEDQTPPEMQRLDLAGAILQLKALGVDDVLHFDFVSPPAVALMLHGLEVLHSLGALRGDDCGLTTEGRRLASLPLEPRLAKVLLGSLRPRNHSDGNDGKATAGDATTDETRGFGCAKEILPICAMLSIKDVWLPTRGRRALSEKLDVAMKEFAVTEGDHITLLNVFNAYRDELTDGGRRAGSAASSEAVAEWCRENMLNQRALEKAVEAHRQLLSYVKQEFAGSNNRRGSSYSSDFELPSCDGDTAAVRRCLLSGFFASVVRLGNDGLYHALRDNGANFGREGMRGKSEGRLGRSRRGGDGDCNYIFQLHPTSTLAKFGSPAEYVMFHRVVSADQELVCGCSRIDGRWLLELAPHYYSATPINKAFGDSGGAAAPLFNGKLGTGIGGGTSGHGLNYLGMSGEGVDAVTSHNQIGSGGGGGRRRADHTGIYGGNSNGSEYGGGSTIGQRAGKKPRKGGLNRDRCFDVSGFDG